MHTNVNDYQNITQYINTSLREFLANSEGPLVGNYVPVTVAEKINSIMTSVLNKPENINALFPEFTELQKKDAPEYTYELNYALDLQESASDICEPTLNMQESVSDIQANKNNNVMPYHLNGIKVYELCYGDPFANVDEDHPEPDYEPAIIDTISLPIDKDLYDRLDYVLTLESIQNSLIFAIQECVEELQQRDIADHMQSLQQFLDERLGPETYDDILFSAVNEVAYDFLTSHSGIDVRNAEARDLVNNADFQNAYQDMMSRYQRICLDQNIQLPAPQLRELQDITKTKAQVSPSKNAPDEYTH